MMEPITLFQKKGLSGLLSGVIPENGAQAKNELVGVWGGLTSTTCSVLNSRLQTEFYNATESFLLTQSVMYCDQNSVRSVQSLLRSHVRVTRDPREIDVCETETFTNCVKQFLRISQILNRLLAFRAHHFFARDSFFDDFE